MKYILRAKTHNLKGDIELPGSKSISNRVLIIKALSAKPFQINQLSNADDTSVLSKALERNDIITDVGPAGTAMRFLTAYYATQPGEKVLTGSSRMKQRPIALLVDALRQLGAHITYLENEGFPPLHIEGRRLKGGEINIDGNVSSQFITALMLIAPTLPQALKIKIKGDPLSRPYILMTQNLMVRCGAQVEIADNVITVHPGRYRSKEFTIERDWSSAAFWMSFAALSRKSDITLTGLTEDSIQGDKSAVELFEKLGLNCTFTEKGLRVQKNGKAPENETWNFRNHPDLVPPAAFAAAGLRQNFSMSGLDNLRLKETDRIAALETELHKIGVSTETEGHSMNVKASDPHSPETYFESYDDHRMVMAVAPMSMLFSEFQIENPMAVAKSYPGFWNQVEKFVDVRPTR